jgi:Clp protease
VRWSSLQHGQFASCLWIPRDAVFSAKRQNHDTSALRWCSGKEESTSVFDVQNSYCVSLQGQATDIQIQAEEIIKLKNQINGLYVKHTGLQLERIRMFGNLYFCNFVFISYVFSEASMERDKFMSPYEAKEFGIIDTILNHPPKMGNAAVKPEDSN